jgi:hypothetical protein
MRAIAGVVYRWLAALFLAAVVVQFFLAGLGVFRTQHETAGKGARLTTAAFDHSFGPHIALGDVLVLVSAALVVAALVARLGRGVLMVTVAVLLLVIVEAVLASAGPPGARALHPVVGLGVLGTAGYAMVLAGVPWPWRGRRGSA